MFSPNQILKRSLYSIKNGFVGRTFLFATETNKNVRFTTNQFNFSILLTICLLFLFCQNLLFAQNDIPVGSWRMHLTYRDAHTLAISPSSVFVASSNGLFEFEIESKKTKPLFKKIDGLSDIGISRLAYHNSSKTLVIGYQNGNIDLWREKEIINVRSILNSVFPSKRINHLDFQDNSLYISTDFGVVVFDLQRLEVSENYVQIGENGERLSIFSLAFTNDSIFALSEKGIRASSRNRQINKQDFRNWRSVLNAPNLSKTIVALKNTLFYGINNQSLYTYESGKITPVSQTAQLDFADLSLGNGQMIVSAKDRILTISENRQVQTFLNEKIIQPRQAVLDSDNKLWIADFGIGLVTNKYGAFQQYAPSGVFSSQVWNLRYFDNKLIATSGGYASNYPPLNRQTGFYVFETNEWKNFNAIDPFALSIKTPLVRDLVASAYHPTEKTFYLASFQDGLFSWNTENNSFRLLQNPQIPLLGNRVGGILVDSRNDLWVSNHNVLDNSPSIFKRNSNGTWQSFTFKPEGGIDAKRPLELMESQGQLIWVRLSPNVNGGALVFDPKNGKYKYLTSNNLDGADLNILAMTIDRNDDLWIGTEKGLRVLNGASAFLEKDFNARKVAVNQNNAFLFLEKITAIAVDGGNRKWIGTEKGLWLHDEKPQQIGKEVIHQFTAENSPLLSNKIVSIAVHDRTGEVFIGTDLGIVSFRGMATEGGFDFSQAKIFPNPVPPNFEGYITISGLANDANVKITDISGKIVFETTAEGGTAVWQGRDLSGKKAKTGVYLVYSSFNRGEETFVGKIGFIE